MLALSAIDKEYGRDGRQVCALQRVSLTIGSGELCAIVGPSGSGKTTLMNLIGLLDRPTRGLIAIDGVEMQNAGPDTLARLRNRLIGFVFQAFHLLPRLSAIDNVALPLIYRGIPRAEARPIASGRLRQLGLGDRLEHKPWEMSGGQRQRVAIARALVGEPSIILADEPTGNLDADTARSTMDILVSLSEQNGLTVIVVTHDEMIARRCRRKISLAGGHVISDVQERSPSDLRVIS